MKKKEILASFSVGFLLTVALFTHELLCDKPATPYTLRQYIMEAIIGGSFFTGAFSVIVYSALQGVKEVFKLGGIRN